jgi:hypothetical protein
VRSLTGRPRSESTPHECGVHVRRHSAKIAVGGVVTDAVGVGGVVAVAGAVAVGVVGVVAGAVVAVGVWPNSGDTVKPQHISSPTRYPDHTQNSRTPRSWDVEPDGICHCVPRTASSAIGECPQCHRLDIRRSYA